MRTAMFREKTGVFSAANLVVKAGVAFFPDVEK